jgi:hypothetical protein
MKQHKNGFILIVFLVFFFGNKLSFAQKNELGEGFFSPKTDEIETLYLYDIPNSRAGSQERIIDSITFHKRDNWAHGISHAPKDFNPYHEKLDYGVFILKVKRLGRDYTEIIINEKTGETAYVNSQQGNFMTWGQFFLNCNSVEFIDKNQKVFDNPMIKSAGRVVNPANFRARYIMGDWMEVEILADDYDTVKGKGWIQWKKDGKLLITYNLFS